MCVEALLFWALGQSPSHHRAYSLEGKTHSYTNKYIL